MRRARATWLAAGLAAGLALSLAREARAEGEAPRPRWALEGDLRGFYARTLTGYSGPRPVTSRSGGAGLGGTVLLRSPYFLSPFFDVSWAPLRSAVLLADLGAEAGGVAASTSSVGTVGVVFGAALDVGPVRALAAVGTYDTVVRSQVRGVRMMTTELDLGYALGLQLFALRVPTGRRTFKVGADVRAGIVSEAGMAYATFGLVLAEDALAW